MANELQAETTPGLTLYAVLISATGTFWNTAGTPGLEAYNGANWTDYDIALTEAGAGVYLGDMPAAAAGVYSYAVYSQAGASPATTDTLKGTGFLAWDGSAEIVPSDFDPAADTVDVGKISGDATAADNLKLQFDGTGVVGDQYPSTQAQLANIVITGSPAYVGASSYVLTTGTQTGGTYESTDTSNGVYHVHTDTGGVLSFYYEYLLAADEVATGIVFKGRITGPNDSALIQAYNWVGSAFVTLFTLTGTGGTTDTNQSPALVAKYTGTGADVGKVRIRILNAVSLTTATMYVDQLIVGKTITNRSVGYQNGAVWIDATNGTAGSSAFVNGTVDNPCTTIAEAYSIAATVGLTSINVAPGTTVTLTQAADKWRFEGNGRIALGGQSIADATFKDLYTISGLSTGDDAFFENCGIGDATIYHAYFERCRMKGTLTFAASQYYFFDRCYDANESSSVQVFVFAANAAAMFRDWRGGIQLNSMAATNEAIIDGAGRVVIDASSVGGSITIRGHFPAATGATAFVTAGGTITDTARWAEDQNITNVTGSVSALATDAITAASLKTDAVTEIQLGLSTLTAAQVNAEVVDALTVDVIADSVATDGSRPTIAQALLMLNRFLMERAVTSTTMTVTKEDGTTAVMTFTLNDADTPSAITRAS